jgi:hypothetical protein
MRLRHQALALVVAAPLACLFFSTRSHADIPPGYKGTPFKGVPAPIPGRINLVDYDTGGVNVGFNTTHRSDAAPVGCAGSDYRTDLPVPTLCKTSQMDNDHYTAGPLMGTYYPSPTTADYYIGAIRPNDWVNVTVNVKTTGTYVLTSVWASAGGSIDMKVFFNDVLKNETKAPTTGGYHNWVPFPNYAMVQLDAGVQVMKFQSVVEHLNWDYIQFSLMLPDGGVDNGDPDAGAPGMGIDAGSPDAGGAGTGSGGASTGGEGGAAGTSVATGGTGGGGPTTGAGGEPGQGGGSTATGSGGSSSMAGSAGHTASGAAADPGGCACTFERPSRSRGQAASFALALMAFGALFRRRSSAAWSEKICLHDGR